MSRFIVSCVTAVSVLLFAAGCASVPQQSVDQVKAVIDSAKAEGAEIYCAEQLKSAQVSYDLAMTEISDQGKKLAFMRNYQKASELLQGASSAAASAKNDVAVNKQKIQTEVQDVINQATANADSATAKLAAAKKKKKDITLLTADLDTAKAWITAATGSITSGDLIAAKEKAAAITLKVNGIIAVVDSMMAPAAK